MDTCGAKTRAGTPCKQKAIYENGRCKFHGGLATGPVTEAGKEQCRINGRKGGRPRKAGVVETGASHQQGARLLSNVAVSEAAIESEIMAANENPKTTLSNSSIPHRHFLPMGADQQTPVAMPISAELETEILQLGKTSVSVEISGGKLGSVPANEMSIDVHVLAGHEQREIIPDKPKSCMLKDVKVFPNCSRCEMLASNGACLAVAKGLIPCVPASETCTGFVAFEKT